MKTIRLGTVCSGGLSAPEYALQKLNYKHEIVFACEIDKSARKNYLANYPIKAGHFHRDLNTLKAKQYKNKVDIIVGGTPKSLRKSKLC